MAEAKKGNMTQQEYNTIFSTLQTMRNTIEVWYKNLVSYGLVTENALCYLPDWTAEPYYQYAAENAENRISTLVMTFNGCYLKKVYTILTKNDSPLSTWSILDRGIAEEVNITWQLVEGIMKSHWADLTVVLKTEPLQKDATTDQITSLLKQLCWLLDTQKRLKPNKKK